MKYFRLAWAFTLLAFRPCATAAEPLAFNYTYLDSPSSSYPDTTGRELSDGASYLWVWPNENFDAGGLVGWSDRVFARVRFDFSTTTALETATFWFADSHGAAGVSFPSILRLYNSSFSYFVEARTPLSDTFGTTAAYTFNLGGLLTDNLILEMEPNTQWAMMSEATFTGTAIPEPSAYGALAGVAILGVTAWRRRRGARSLRA